ncbi:MAG: glycosyltransferase family 4 protein [Candidatus Gracilibacteria bacterium]|nr:glycosyltransferase family 4 protein [Candidatus Gracilibacteria bacterium]
MKILFILDLYKPHIGGVEILFENIISRLASAGNDIVVLTSKYDKSLEKYEKNGNIEIYRVGNNRYDFMFYSIFTGIKLAKKCDIIHTTTYNSAIPASLIGMFSGKKVVLTVHEIFGQLWYKFMGFKGFFFKIFESLIFKFPYQKYICVSNYTKNSLRIHFGLDDSKLITIYNGIDYSFWNRDNFDIENFSQIRKDLGLENNYVGLFYGRPGISKGLEYYIKAIPEIVKKVPEFKALLIVPHSSNNPITKIENLIDDLKIRDNIVLIPAVSNLELPNYILVSDFVIIPSLVEGFGFAVAEVSALGQNLITTEVAAIPEVACGNVNFVEPGNISDIVKKVIDFKNGKCTKITKKEFRWEENIEKTLDVYKEILK